MIQISPTPAVGIVQSNVLKSFTVANTTGSIVLWRLTGIVLVKKLYGIVETTPLSANITAAHFRLNDQTATYDITLAAGTALSAAVVGRMISKRALVATALEASGGLTNIGAVLEPSVTLADPFSPFVLIKKTAANTDIEFRYTTTDNPSTGAMRFFIEYQPMSFDGLLAPQ